MTGSEPGRPKHTGQTLVFGRCPKFVLQPQKSLVFVNSCAWTSSPITTSYSVTARHYSSRFTAMNGSLIFSQRGQEVRRSSILAPSRATIPRRFAILRSAVHTEPTQRDFRTRRARAAQPCAQKSLDLPISLFKIRGSEPVVG